MHMCKKPRLHFALEPGNFQGSGFEREKRQIFSLLEEEYLVINSGNHVHMQVISNISSSLQKTEMT